MFSCVRKTEIVIRSLEALSPLRNRRVSHRAIEIESEDSQYESFTKIVSVGFVISRSSVRIRLPAHLNFRFWIFDFGLIRLQPLSANLDDADTMSCRQRR